MILRSSYKRIIQEEGAKFGLTADQAIEYYMSFIDEYLIKHMYEANFYVLEIKGLGYLTVSQAKIKQHLHYHPNTNNREVYERLFRLSENMYSTLKRKRNASKRL